MCVYMCVCLLIRTDCDRLQMLGVNSAVRTHRTAAVGRCVGDGLGKHTYITLRNS